jgi:hypothetical protein
MTSADFANAFAFAVFGACLFRARLLALALIPPCLLILARVAGLVDLSSASHPLRWVVPVTCAGLAGLALVFYFHMIRHWQQLRTTNLVKQHDGMIASIIMGYKRQTLASILVVGSCAPDLLALHPFFWARFAEWPLVPIQIFVCFSILAVLLAPERWIGKWIR